MDKSELYNEFAFAVKFINRESVIYHDCFPGPKVEPVVYGARQCRTLPIGRTIDDMGPVLNNFHYQDQSLTAFGSTDAGTSRAYRVLLDEDTKAPITVVCVTHESGLEIFLVSAATLVGIETTKFALKSVLERIENRINEWLRKKRGQAEKQSAGDEKPIVEKIAMRTPAWQITVDGSFSRLEREKIIEYFSTHLVPTASAASYLRELDNRALYDKTIAKAREVVQF